MGNRLVLWSEKRKREVVGLNSTQLDLSFSGLPVVRFLASLSKLQILPDMQSLSTSSVKQLAVRILNGAELIAEIFPCISYDRIVLKPKRWIIHLNADCRSAISKANPEEFLLQLQAGLSLPSTFAIRNVERDLAIDSYSALDRAGLKRQFMKSETVELVEAPAQNGLAMEFLLPVIIAIPRISTWKPASIKSYTLGADRIGTPEFDENGIVAFRIYTNSQTSDRVLQLIQTILTSLSKTIDTLRGWFFTRYYDTHYHIRLRISFSEPLEHGVVELIDRSLVDGLGNITDIWRISADRFEFESQRFGGVYKRLQAFEVFIASSLVAVELTALDSFDGDDTSYAALGAMLVFGMLQAYGATIHEALSSVTLLCDKAMRNMTNRAQINKAIGLEYRKHSGWFGRLFREFLEEDTDEESLQSLLKFFARLRVILESSQSKGEREESRVVNLHIHMMLNRLFSDRHSVLELCTYQWLRKFLLRYSMEAACFAPGR